MSQGNVSPFPGASHETPIPVNDQTESGVWVPGMGKLVKVENSATASGVNTGDINIGNQTIGGGITETSPRPGEAPQNPAETLGVSDLKDQLAQLEERQKDLAKAVRSNTAAANKGAKETAELRQKFEEQDTKLQADKDEILRKVEDQKAELSQQIDSLRTDFNQKIDEQTAEIDDQHVEMGRQISDNLTELSRHLGDVMRSLTDALTRIGNMEVQLAQTNRDMLQQNRDVLDAIRLLAAAQAQPPAWYNNPPAWWGQANPGGGGNPGNPGGGNQGNQGNQGGNQGGAGGAGGGGGVGGGAGGGAGNPGGGGNNPGGGGNNPGGNNPGGNNPGAPGNPNAPNPAQQNQQPQGPTPEQDFNNAQTALQAARDALLEITIRRKARSGDGMLLHRRRNDRPEYHNAMFLYRQAFEDVLDAYRLLTQAQNPNLQFEILAQHVLRFAYEEQKAFANREVELNNEYLDQLGFRGKVMRRWANMSATKKIALGLLVGVGASVGSGVAGLGLVGLAVGSAAKFSLGLMNRRASLRNVSEKSLQNQLSRINREQIRALAAMPSSFNNLMPDADLQNYRNIWVDRIRSNYEGEIQSAQRRNRRGNFLLGVSGVAVVLGAASQLDMINIPDFNTMGIAEDIGSRLGEVNWPDINWPDVNWDGINWPDFGGIFDHSDDGPSATDAFSPGETPGGPGFTGPGGTAQHVSKLMPSFRPDSFKGTRPHDAVKNAFTVFGRNNIEVHGLTNAKVDEIVQAMKDQHFPIAIGMNADKTQHIIDSAQAYAGPTTPNRYPGWEGMQRVNGSSAESWKRFAALAQQHGVTFSRKPR